MDARQITRNALARAINTRFEVIDKWYNGHVEKIDSDILARICFVLDCLPGDIIRYSSKKDN
ncbi:MAG: helix-turn-helix transcriptional regulator [Lachnospiraceae bacterium]|nr:helix-turn-helix transcriptional regulator [Lachnospiraceae bacterium]